MEAVAPPKPKTKRKKIIIVVVLLLLVIGAYIKIIFFKAPFYYAGTIETTKVDMSAQVASTISDVFIHEGDSVSENQKLIELKCDDLKVVSDLANINFNRQNRLVKSGAVTKESFDLAKNRKDDADVKMSWCHIKSPLSGTVLTRYHEPGELVTPGMKLLTLANVRDVWAYIYVPQPLVTSLQIGMKIKARLPELKGREFIGSIVKINDEAEFTPKNVQTRTERERLIFGVKISFLGANDDETLKPGMSIEAELPEGTHGKQ